MGVSLSCCPLTPAASDTAPFHDTTADESSRDSPRSGPRRPHRRKHLLRGSECHGRFSVEPARTGGICGAVEVRRDQLRDPEGSQKEQNTLIWCHNCLTFPGCVSRFEACRSCFNGDNSQCQTYLLIKQAGGRGSAGAAAAVTRLRLRSEDCQLEISSTVAVRRAQRDCWDVTGGKKEGEKDGDDYDGEEIILKA